MNVIKEIKNAWGWIGIDPQEVVVENEFGNLIIKDPENRFWRLSPEDVSCEVVAASIDDYNVLIQDEAFVEDWFMTAMVGEATKKLGKLKSGHKYYMVVPGALGGEYGGSNVKMAPFTAIIKFSGALGKQIKEQPDGAEIKYKPLSY